MEHVKTSDELLKIFHDDTTLLKEESYILFNTTAVSDFSMSPSDLGYGEKVPCHLVGITDKAAITIDVSNWGDATTENLQLYNLTVDWSMGDASSARVTINNFTYLGCRAYDETKKPLAMLQEVITDIDLTTQFGSLYCSGLTLVMDRLSGSVAFTQELVVGWTALHVKLVSSGADVNVSIMITEVTVTMPHATVVVEMAQELGNKLMFEISDCLYSYVEGHNSGAFYVSLSYANASECVLANELWLRGASILLDNSNGFFDTNQYVPKLLTMKGRSNLFCRDTLYIESTLEIDGDANFDIENGGMIAVKNLAITSGSLTTNGVTSVVCDYLSVSRVENVSFEISEPVTIFKAVRPGTIDLSIKELHFWSHSSGIDLIFDRTLHEYRPIIVKNLISFANEIPVNVRFEYGLPMTQPQLASFIMLARGRTFSLLKYENDAKISGYTVFNYYAETDEQKEYYHGFTDDTSIFYTNVSDDGLLTTFVDGDYVPSNELAVCLSTKENQGLCPSDGSAIWIDIDSSDMWAEHLTQEVTSIIFQVEDSVGNITFDLSLLNPRSEYSISLFSTTDFPYVEINFSQEVCNAIKHLSMESIDVVLPDVKFQVRSLSIQTAFISDMITVVMGGESCFVSIDEFMCNAGFFGFYEYLMAKTHIFWINGLEPYQTVRFVDTGWLLQAADSELNLTSATIGSASLRMLWPAGGTAPFYSVIIESEHPCKTTFYSDVELVNIVLEGTVDWNLFYMNGTFSSYMVTLSSQQTFAPFEFDLSTPGTYEILLLGGSTNQVISFKDEIYLGSGATLQLFTDNKYSEVVFEKPVTLQGARLEFGAESPAIVRELNVLADRFNGNEVTGAKIDQKVTLMDNALLHVWDTSLKDSEVTLQVESTTECPTLILSTMNLPRRINLVHEFYDEQFSNELKWYWFNFSPVICWTGHNMSEIMAITNLEVIGSKYFTISLFEGTSSGRKCAMLDRNYNRSWTASMIVGFVVGLIMVLGCLMTIAIKCSTVETDH